MDRWNRLFELDQWGLYVVPNTQFNRAKKYEFGRVEGDEITPIGAFCLKDTNPYFNVAGLWFREIA